MSDSATLSGVTATAGGTIVFTLFGPSATPACSGTPVFTSAPVPVSGPGTYGPVTATVTVAGTYWWLTAYSGDANNRAVSSTCGDENSLVIQPTIVTVATPTATLPGATLSDRATLSAVTDTAGGKIEFTLFGPTPTAACSGTPVFTSGPVTVNGPGTYGPVTTTVDVAGTFWWVAPDSGDDATTWGPSSTCGEEQSVIDKSSPSIVTNPTATAPLPAGTLVDQATLSGFQSPLQGTVTFNVYVPSTTGECVGPLFTSTVPIAADGTATSELFTPTLAGTYWWVAAYSGDANNLAVSSGCGEEQSLAVPVSPTIATTPTSTATLPAGTLVDLATLSGFLPPLQQPDGTPDTVTLNLYGPSPTASCIGGAVFASTVNIAADGTATSAAFTPTQVGTYWWLATFNGDQNNRAVSSACGDEQSVVGAAVPSIVTTATAAASQPGAVGSDSATLSAVTATAGGTIVFTLFGPSATPACGGTAVFTSAPVAVNGPGTYGPVTTTGDGAGSFWGVAASSGDANNLAVSSACGDEQSVVAAAGPSIVTTATATAPLPAGTLVDQATLSGFQSPLQQPDGTPDTVTFNLYGPSPTAACSGTAVFTSMVHIAADGTASSDPFTPTQAGTYWWVAMFNGDANNKAVSSTCGQEQSVVARAVPKIVTTTGLTRGLPTAAVSDRAILSDVTATAGGTIVFTLHGPSPTAACSGSDLVFTSAPIPVNGPGTYGPVTAPVTRPRHLLVGRELQRRRQQPGRVVDLRRRAVGGGASGDRALTTATAGGNPAERMAVSRTVPRCQMSRPRPAARSWSPCSARQLLPPAAARRGSPRTRSRSTDQAHTVR